MVIFLITYLINELCNFNYCDQTICKQCKKNGQNNNSDRKIIYGPTTTLLVCRKNLMLLYNIQIAGFTHTKSVYCTHPYTCHSKIMCIKSP